MPSAPAQFFRLPGAQGHVGGDERQAQEEGYTVTLMYFWLNSPDLAVARVKARVEAGGHNIPEETVRRRYDMGLKYFFRDYAPICDRWILADNSNIPFRVIAEGSKDSVINIKDKETYERIRNAALASADDSED